MLRSCFPAAWLIASAFGASGLAAAVEEQVAGASSIVSHDAEAEQWVHRPEKKVTLNYLFVEGEEALMGNIIKTLFVAKFCFSEIYVILDVPHGGQGGDPADGVYSAGYGGYDTFLTSKAGLRTRCLAEYWASRGRTLVQKHCPADHKVTWVVEVMNYDRPSLEREMLDHYDIPAVKSNLHGYDLFQTMWRNAGTYIHAVTEAAGDYVLHADSQWVLSVVNETYKQGFVEDGLDVFDAEPAAYMLSPHDVRLKKFTTPETFNGTTERSQNLINTRGCIPLEKKVKFAFEIASCVSLEIFLADKTRLMSLMPLPMVDKQTELSWSQLLHKKPGAAYFLYMQGRRMGKAAGHGLPVEDGTCTSS